MDINQQLKYNFCQGCASRQCKCCFYCKAHPCKCCPVCGYLECICCQNCNYNPCVCDDIKIEKELEDYQKSQKEQNLYENENAEDEDIDCPVCNQNKENCECCMKCQNLMDDCQCCIECNQIPCICCEKCSLNPCQCCQQCKEIDCICCNKCLNYHPNQQNCEEEKDLIQ